MENELDEISNGKRPYLETMKNFYGPFQKAIADKKNMAKISDLGGPEKYHLSGLWRANDRQAFTYRQVL